MKRVLTLLACLILTPVVWADDAAPPPLPADSSSQLPPPVDVKDLTPLPELPQGSDNQNPVPVTNIQAVPTDTPVPAPAQVEAPTATSTPEPVVPPTATPEPAAPGAEEKPVEKEVPAASTGSTSPAPQAGSTALSDYFPAAEGAQWSYEYLKPAAGQTAKATFTVKCTSAKTMANGTVRAVFEATGGHQSRDRYSLFNNSVQHMGTGDQALTGDFAFKLPSKEASASWSLTGKDGTAHKFKAAFGQAQVYQKTYPDCVVVTEKLAKDGQTVNTLINYYAKGIGLVALEVYSPAMKLIQDKSFALTAGPGSN